MVDADPASWIGWLAALGLGAERLVKLVREHRSSKIQDEDAIFARALKMVERYEAEIRDLRERHREEMQELRTELMGKIEELEARLDTLQDERDTLAGLLEKQGGRN